MTTSQQIRRNYGRAGSLPALMAPFDFIDAGMFATKAGHFGMVWRLGGVDGEGLDEEGRAQISRHISDLLRLLDERYRVYSYLVRDSAPTVTARVSENPAVMQVAQARADLLTSRGGQRFVNTLYLVVVYEWATQRVSSIQPGVSLLRSLSPRVVIARAAADEARAGGEFLRMAGAIEAQIRALVPTRLGSHDSVRFLRSLVTYDGNDAVWRDGIGIDRAMVGADVEWVQRAALDVGRAKVRVLTMKEAPDETWGGIGERFGEFPCQGVVCVEWCRRAGDRAIAEVDAKSTWAGAFRVKMLDAWLAKNNPHAYVGVDKSADAIIEQLAEAKIDGVVRERIYGDCSLSVVLHDPDIKVVDAAVSSLHKTIAQLGGQFHEETYNLLNAWAAIVPGNHLYNVRRMLLLDTHYADLACVFAPSVGDSQRAFVVLEGRHGVPYYYAMHVQDVGHTAVLGETGSGKSFCAGFLVMHSQVLNPRTVIFDLGHSYRALCDQLGGSYVTLGSGNRVTINPFACEPAEEQFEFLSAFLGVLLESGGGSVRSEDHLVIDAAVRAMMVQPVGYRRLGNILLPPHLMQWLAQWIRGGRYAHWFDHAVDTLEVNPFQVYEFNGLEDRADVLEPMLFYVLHRVQAQIGGGRDLTLCVMDEAWRFIKHQALRDYVERALKTWRKQNAALWLVTQGIEDFERSGLQRAVVEGCPTKLFLANPDQDLSVYARIFNLNARECELLREVKPKQQVLLKRPGVTKVLDVHVDPAHVHLYGMRAPEEVLA